jgi:hypothetical protein
VSQINATRPSGVSQVCIDAGVEEDETVSSDMARAILTLSYPRRHLLAAASPVAEPRERRLASPHGVIVRPRRNGGVHNSVMSSPTRPCSEPGKP